MSKEQQILQQCRAELEGKSILLVDDQAFVRRLVARMLDDIKDLQLYDATDGADAIRKLSINQIDAVLLDINMRPVNGLEALKAIRIGVGAAPRNIPVTMLTTVSDERAVRTAIELDANGFIVKPASLSSLLKRLARGVTQEIDMRPEGVYANVDLPDLEGVDQSTNAELEKVVPGLRRKTRTPRPGHEIVELKLGQVKAGDILVDGVFTRKGTTLVAEETVLNDQMISRLGDLNEIMDTWDVSVERKLN